MIAAAVAHPPPETGTALTRTVSMDDAGFSPAALVAAPGTAITWVNVGRNRHTVTAGDGAFDSGGLAPGASFRLTAPATTGVYAYHCSFHGYMRGTLTVSLVSLATPPTVTAGRRPMLAGVVPGVAAGTVVRVERRVPGAWVEVGAAAVDAAGGYRISGPPLTGRTAFRAVVGDDLSPSVRATARPHVAVRRTGPRLRVAVEPAGGAHHVHLERLDLDTYRWTEVATRPLAAGRAAFRLRTPGVYRAAVPAHRGLEAAASRDVPFRAAAFRQ